MNTGNTHTKTVLMSWLANASIWVRFNGLIFPFSTGPVSAPSHVGWCLVEHFEFYLIVLWVSSYSYKYFKLCSGAQVLGCNLIYLVLHFRFVLGRQSSILSRANSSPLPRWILLSTHCPMDYGFSSLAGRCGHTFLAPGWYCFLPSFQMIISLPPMVSLQTQATQVSTE